MNIKWYNDICLQDVELVGGKNASLGEMIRNVENLNIDIPYGFAVSTTAYDLFLNYNNLDTLINNRLSKLKLNNNLENLKETGEYVRNEILKAKIPSDLRQDITSAYKLLSGMYKTNKLLDNYECDVAVRSSGTMEDLPDASFAGQQDTFLNVSGSEDVVNCIKKCFASLYTDRAISYRLGKNLIGDVKISVGVQKMIRSDLGSAGVAFSIDTDSGFDKVILINGSFGLGELVVSGKIKPDEILVFKPKVGISKLPILEKKFGEKHIKMVYSSDKDQKIKIVPLETERENKMCIDDENILLLSKWIIKLEQYYSKLYNKWCPLDVEWAIDGNTNKLYVVQARPETIYSKKDKNIIKKYSINKSSITSEKVLLEGVAVGDKISKGIIKKIDDISEFSNFNPGEILLTDMTDPDWEPLMKISSGIITNRGGRTCHAAIVARELGVPAVVATVSGTEVLKNGQKITLSCAEGEVGKIYEGFLDYIEKNINLLTLPKIKTKLLLNLASPDNSFAYHNYPVDGVGLVREEFIFSNYIKIHPMALLNHKTLNDKDLSGKILNLCKGYHDETDYFIKKLSYGISKIASTFYPKPVILRFSDFKSNEYCNLMGGKYFEPKEENPMIGWRGASRYYSKNFIDAFGLECKAIKYVREVIGLENVIVMIPFCRTVRECLLVQNTMKKYGLERGVNGLQVYLMCEIPSNVILADEFCKYVDGYSIGSNDLTQLILGLDRDSELVQNIYDERDDAVKYMIRKVITSCKKNKTKIGICGQGPSDYPEIAEFLVREGIDTISITPDSLINTIDIIHKVEKSKL